VREAGLEAYVLYAHYLALLLLQATPDLIAKKLPEHSLEVRKEIVSRYGEVNFGTTLRREPP